MSIMVNMKPVYCSSKHRKCDKTIWLIIIFLFLSLFFRSKLTLVSALKGNKYEANKLELEEIEQYVNRMTKISALSFEEEGHIIDCIPIDKQASLDHPLLKNHTVQMESKSTVYFKKAREEWTANGPKSVFGTRDPNKIVCPKGTTPIQRMTVDDVLRAGGLSKFGKKDPNQPPMTTNGSSGSISNEQLPREYAAVGTMGSLGLKGAQAAFNLWEPTVEIRQEFSLAQVWLTSEDTAAHDFNSIEAGWMVCEEIYGDKKVKLFVYHTTDGYRTGCYNLDCGGFVQVSHEFRVGQTIGPVSQYGGPQYELPMVIYKGRQDGNWWFSVNDKDIGYWPKELFTKIRDSAARAAWGGEVVNSKPGGRHTRTPMGSGHFAQERNGNAGYVRNIMLIDSNHHYGYVGNHLYHTTTRPECYSMVLDHNAEWGTHVFYGGPGYNAHCR